MATLLSAQMAKRSEKVSVTGHGRGRPKELLTPFGDGTSAGERHEGDWYHERHYS